MSKFISIYHPDLEGEGVVSDDAFEKVWKDKGFKKGPRPEKKKASTPKVDLSESSDSSDDESTTKD